MSPVHASQSWLVKKPELKELDKVDTKPISNIESETKPSDVESDVRHQPTSSAREEWRRYVTAAKSTDDNLLRDQLLQCAEVSQRRTLQNTIVKQYGIDISCGTVLRY